MGQDIITVGRFIEMLSKFNKDLPIGVVGHFGELFEFEYDCLTLCEAMVDRSGKSKSWKQLTQEDKEQVLNITAPYIGEGPN